MHQRASCPYSARTLTRSDTSSVTRFAPPWMKFTALTGAMESPLVRDRNWHCSERPGSDGELFDTPGLFRQNRKFRSEGFPSGQREQTVNLPAMPSKVRILPPPPDSSGGMEGDRFGCTGAENSGPSAASGDGVSMGFAERGCSSMVEQKPSKLTTRVRFPSPAPTGYRWVLGYAACRGRSPGAHVAQWQSTPLVRERSSVQSAPWAPFHWYKVLATAASRTQAKGIGHGERKV